MPRYEFTEGTSKKFWEIELDDSSFTTRWGRIGADGQEKTQDFDSAAEAKKEYQKLIASKVKKGYQLVGGEDEAGEEEELPVQSNPELEAAIEKNLDDPQPYLVYADWLQSHGDARGELIALSHQGKADTWIESHREALLGRELVERLEWDPPELKVDWHLGFIRLASLKRGGYDSDTDVPELTQAFLALPVCRFIRGLTFGLTGWESDNDYTEVVAAIVESGRGKTLEHIFFGDFEYPDDTEMSWAPWGDLGALWAAAPHLKSFKLRGAGGTFGALDLPKCRWFTVETGGLDQAAVTAIAKATWPSLERLELWTGSEEYGAGSGVDDLLPLLEARAVPRLTHFGLRNSEYTDALVPLLANSKLLKQLKSLDLSMGTLSEAGCQAILDHAAAFAHLESLDLSQSFVPEAMFDRLRAVCAKVNLDEQREPYDWEDAENGGRYVAVGE
jgi:uncharacterized protein (TIGR02996 family)